MNTGTMSMRVTRVIHCRKTYAALALAGLIASLSGAAAADNDKEATPPAGRTRLEDLEDLQQKIVGAQRETPEESVQMLMQDPLIDYSFSSVSGGKAYLNRMERDPRIAKLLDLARNGSEDQRASLLAEVKKMCLRFVEKLPLVPESSDDFSPTVFSPGGASAYPLLLSILDDKMETLPLLLEMRDRHVKALRKWLAEDFEERVGIGYEKAEETRVGSQFLHVVAYACWKLLGKYDEGTPAMRFALTPRQAQILVEFAEFSERTGPADGWVGSNQKNVFQFAQDFVQAADR